MTGGAGRRTRTCPSPLSVSLSLGGPSGHEPQGAEGTPYIRLTGGAGQKTRTCGGPRASRARRGRCAPPSRSAATPSAGIPRGVPPPDFGFLAIAPEEMSELVTTLDRQERRASRARRGRCARLSRSAATPSAGPAHKTLYLKPKCVHVKHAWRELEPCRANSRTNADVRLQPTCN